MSGESVSAAPPFDSGSIAKGSSFSLAFDAPGTYQYRCAILSTMTGTVVVTN